MKDQTSQSPSPQKENLGGDSLPGPQVNIKGQYKWNQETSNCFKRTIQNKNQYITVLDLDFNFNFEFQNIPDENDYSDFLGGYGLESQVSCKVPVSSKNYLVDPLLTTCLTCFHVSANSGEDLFVTGVSEVVLADFAEVIPTFEEVTRNLGEGIPAYSSPDKVNQRLCTFDFILRQEFFLKRGDHGNPQNLQKSIDFTGGLTIIVETMDPRHFTHFDLKSHIN